MGLRGLSSSNSHHSQSRKKRRRSRRWRILRGKNKEGRGEGWVEEEEEKVQNFSNDQCNQEQDKQQDGVFLLKEDLLIAQRMTGSVPWQQTLFALLSLTTRWCVIQGEGPLKRICSWCFIRGSIFFSDSALKQSGSPVLHSVIPSVMSQQAPLSSTGCGLHSTKTLTLCSETKKIYKSLDGWLVWMNQMVSRPVGGTLGTVWKLTSCSQMLVVSTWFFSSYTDTHTDTHN